MSITLKNPPQTSNSNNIQHSSSKEHDADATLWQVLGPDAAEVLRRTNAEIEEGTTYRGFWCKSAVEASGRELPTNALFIDPSMAKEVTPKVLESFKSKSFAELRAQVPSALELLNSDEGWKAHGSKDGNVFEKKDAGDGRLLVRGKMAMEKNLTLPEFCDIQMCRDFHNDLNGAAGPLKYFKPIVSWLHTSETTWILTFASLCYKGMGSLISDRIVTTASLILFVDKKIQVTVSQSIPEFPFHFCPSPTDAVRLSFKAAYQNCERDGQIFCTAVVEARQAVKMPSFLYVRSALFTQPADWTPLYHYAKSHKAKESLNRNVMTPFLHAAPQVPSTPEDLHRKLPLSF